MKKTHFLTHHLNSINTSLFLKKCHRWLKLITVSYTCRENTVEEMAMCKKDVNSLCQSSIKVPWKDCRRKRWLCVQKMTICCAKVTYKFHIFIASKVVDLSLDIWCLRKALKGLLQNIYLMIELLYHKHNPFITTVVYKTTFLKKHLRL